MFSVNSAKIKNKYHKFIEKAIKAIENNWKMTDDSVLTAAGGQGFWEALRIKGWDSTWHGLL